MFKKLLIHWDFTTQLSLVFTEDELQKGKTPQKTPGFISDVNDGSSPVAVIIE